MSDVLAKCLTCGKQVPTTVSPVPYLFTCSDCGPLPLPDPPQAGWCRVSPRHQRAAVYQTQWGLLCAEHLATTIRIALWGRK